MKMEEDNRPDESAEEEESDAGWYFDLPKGAWERQEAKNRELRQSVRRNMDTEDPRKDVFGGKREPFEGQDDSERPSAWGTNPPPIEPNAGSDLGWSLPGEVEAPSSSAIRHAPGGEHHVGDGWSMSEDIVHSPDAPAHDVEYSTEPEASSASHFKLRSQREDETEPRLKPPPGLFGHSDDEADTPIDVEPQRPRFLYARNEGNESAAGSGALDRTSGSDPEPGKPLIFGAGIDQEARDEPRPFVRGPRRHDEEDEATPFVRGDIQPREPEQPRSRWGEIFGEKASDGASMLDTMRAWARSAEENRDAAESEASARELPQSRGQEPSGGSPLPIRVQRHDDSEPPLVNSEDPQTRWDQMFARKASDDAGVLEGMRDWAVRREDGDEHEGDGPPRMLRAAEPGEVDESLFEPFEWEDATTPETLPSARFPAPALPEAEIPESGEKASLLGKLFGKKKKGDLPPLETAYSASGDESSWLPADEAPEGFPDRRSAGTDDEARFGGWLGRSDGSENRFGVAGASEDDTRSGRLPANDGEEPSEDEEWARKITVAWDSALADASAGPDSAGALTADSDRDDQELPASLSEWFNSPAAAEDDMSGHAQSTVVPPSGPAADSDGDDVWSPEPFESPLVVHGSWAADPGDGIARWVPEEPAAALTSPDPVPDDDPWQRVDAVEAEQEAIPLDQLALDSASSEDDEDTWAPEPIAVAPGLIEPESDDPWAAFMAGRAGEPAGETSYASAPSPEAGSADARAEMGEPASPTEEAVAAGEGSSEPLWESAFARVHPGPGEPEPADEAASPEDVAVPADDPWAAIAQASGFEPASTEIAIFRGSAEVEEALSRFEAEREVEEATEVITSDAAPARFDAIDGAVDLPDWDDSSLEDDTVLRAFQAHASAFDDDIEPHPPATDTEPMVFDELLGADAEEIVAEASQPGAENRYFGRMQGWAPQRGLPSARPAFPWEADRQEAPQPADRQENDEPVLEGWSRVEEPPTPWTLPQAPTSSGHAEAPSVRRRSRSKMLVREIVETGLLALLVFLSVRASFQNFKVDGLSMWPTLEDGEYLIVNKLAYSEVDMDRLSNFVPFVDPGDDPTREVFGGPERGDIVVLKDPGDPDTDLIKRIIGMPGETIEIVDGKVYINDYLLVEPYIKQEWHDTKEKLAIPEGYYFVMGDNRSNSKDSRSSTIGLIPKDLFIGKAMLTYWPRDKFGLAPNEAGDISEAEGRPVVTAEKIAE